MGIVDGTPVVDSVLPEGNVGIGKAVVVGDGGNENVTPSVVTGPFGYGNLSLTIITPQGPRTAVGPPFGSVMVSVAQLSVIVLPSTTRSFAIR